MTCLRSSVREWKDRLRAALCIQSNVRISFARKRMRMRAMARRHSMAHVDPMIAAKNAAKLQTRIRTHFSQMGLLHEQYENAVEWYHDSKVAAFSSPSPPASTRCVRA